MLVSWTDPDKYSTLLSQIFALNTNSNNYRYLTTVFTVVLNASKMMSSTRMCPCLYTNVFDCLFLSRGRGTHQSPQKSPILHRWKQYSEIKSLPNKSNKADFIFWQKVNSSETQIKLEAMKAFQNPEMIINKNKKKKKVKSIGKL